MRAIEIEETGVVKTMIKFAVGSSWVDEVLKAHVRGCMLIESAGSFRHIFIKNSRSK